MTAATPPATGAPAPVVPPATAGGGGGPKGMAALEQSLGGPKRALTIGAVVVVGALALYERHKSSAAAATDATATTDATSLPDWSDLYDQQRQGVNPVPPPTTTTTATPPTAPILQGGNPTPTPGQPIAIMPPVTTPPPVSTPPGKPVAPAPTALNKPYTVVKGDTLWGIAAKYLGNGADYPEIYDANKSVIGPNPNLIKPGEKLLV